MTIGTSRIITGIVVLAAVLGGIFYFNHTRGIAAISTFAECKAAGYQITVQNGESCSTPDGRIFTETSTSTPSTSTATSTAPTTTASGDLRNLNISSNQIVASPLTITGEARGWYFEASFPVELVDGNGVRLAAGPAQAQGDWMTTNFVPFKATLTFAAPKTATGTLILRNDNPSGLPENQKEVRIPVRFSTTERTVSLYYYNQNLDKDASGNILCSAKGLVPVSRVIPLTKTPLQDALRLLLRGDLTASERANGVTTEFPLQNVTLTSASLSSSGALTIALADPLSKTSGGACRAQVLQAQVEATARQFTNVTSVIFTPATLFQP